MTQNDNFDRSRLVRPDSAAVKSASGIKTREKFDSCTFSDVVDRAFEGLKERQIKNSIKRIKEMEERLSALEHELDVFLADRKPS
ncbi:MAG: hypothetical protein FWD40_01610 [Treponema sp.]|nr:hypothetical protein [Treponema sp.]